MQFQKLSLEMSKTSSCVQVLFCLVGKTSQSLGEGLLQAAATSSSSVIIWSFAEHCCWNPGEKRFFYLFKHIISNKLRFRKSQK